MARTYKDMPLYLNLRKRAGKKVTKEEFQKSDWLQNKKYGSWQETSELWDIAWADAIEKGKRNYKYFDSPPKWFRQQLNQQYRAKTKAQFIRGREIDPPKKNAMWLWT